MPDHKALTAKKMAVLARHYRDLRDKRAEIKKWADAEIGRYTEAMSALEAAMLAKLKAEGATSSPTEEGTPYIQKGQSATVVDFDAFWEYVRTQDRPDLMARRANATPIADHNAENPESPVPGVEVTVVENLRVRNPSTT